MSRADHVRAITRGGWALGMVFALVVASAAAASPSADSVDRPVATVNGEVITAEALSRALGSRVYRSDQQRYQFERQKLDDLIAEKLLEQEATRRGIPVARLKEIEVKANVKVSAQDVEAFYHERKDSVPAGEAAAKAAFRRYLEQQQELELTKRLLERLETTANVRIFLAPPPPPTTTITGYLVSPDATFRGPREASVTIVEFADFHCPFCAKEQAVLRQVLEAYPNDVKLVFRHFPLAGIADSQLAAEAAECAAQQGKFWEYHDRLFADVSDLTRPRLHGLAEAVGLEPQGFSRCLEAGTSAARIDEDIAAAKEAGVTGTPTFFVNGRMLEGAVPFATFQKIVDLYLLLRGPRTSARY